jgi:uncharacterized metal-binding protein YceD (DUF177 family)
VAVGNSRWTEKDRVKEMMSSIDVDGQLWGNCDDCLVNLPLPAKLHATFRQHITRTCM